MRVLPRWHGGQRSARPVIKRGADDGQEHSQDTVTRRGCPFAAKHPVAGKVSADILRQRIPVGQRCKDRQCAQPGQVDAEHARHGYYRTDPAHGRYRGSVHPGMCVWGGGCWHWVLIAFLNINISDAHLPARLGHRSHAAYSPPSGVQA